MRSSWTDERLDDLNVKVDRGFESVDRRFEAVDRRFDRVDDEFSELRKEMNSRFDAMDDKFRALNHTLIGCGFGLSASVLGLIAAFVLTAH